uniref:Uncharacterized protein n=1 Tax=Octopus bimaculoides TaxID=37653 RepID=A0A0L8G6Z4_OCTBM
MNTHEPTLRGADGPPAGRPFHRTPKGRSDSPVTSNCPTTLPLTSPFLASPCTMGPLPRDSTWSNATFSTLILLSPSDSTQPSLPYDSPLYVPATLYIIFF